MTLEDIVKILGREARLPCLGNIKIGGLGEERVNAKGGKWRMPRRDDHFTITTLARDEKGNFAPDSELMTELLAEFADTKDKKLRQIPIRVLSDDISEVLQSVFAWYAGKKRLAVSDGKTITWYIDPKTLEKLNPPFEEPWRADILDGVEKNGAKCFKLHATFNCVIASKVGRFGGVYKFRTTSEISFGQMWSGLTYISALTDGLLAGMPLMLCVRKMPVAKEGVGSVDVVHIELRGAGLMELQAKAVELMAWRAQNHKQFEATRTQYKLLAAATAPGTENEDEVAAIAEEFAPDEPPVPQNDEPPQRMRMGGQQAQGSSPCPSTPSATPAADRNTEQAQNDALDALPGPSSERPEKSMPDAPAKVRRNAQLSPTPSPTNHEAPTWEELKKHGITSTGAEETDGIAVFDSANLVLRPDGQWSDGFTGFTVQPRNPEQDLLARQMAAAAMSKATPVVAGPANTSTPPASAAASKTTPPASPPARPAARR